MHCINSADAQIANFNSDAGAFESCYRKTPLKLSIFRRMGSEGWFESKDEDEKFYCLYTEMDTWNDEAFEELLKLVPLDLVTTLNDLE